MRTRIREHTRARAFDFIWRCLICRCSTRCPLCGFDKKPKPFIGASRCLHLRRKNNQNTPPYDRREAQKRREIEHSPLLYACRNKKNYSKTKQKVEHADDLFQMKNVLVSAYLWHADRINHCSLSLPPTAKPFVSDRRPTRHPSLGWRSFSKLMWSAELTQQMDTSRRSNGCKNKKGKTLPLCMSTRGCMKTRDLLSLVPLL